MITLYARNCEFRRVTGANGNSDEQCMCGPIGFACLFAFVSGVMMRTSSQSAAMCTSVVVPYRDDTSLYCVVGTCRYEQIDKWIDTELECGEILVTIGRPFYTRWCHERLQAG